MRKDFSPNSSAKVDVRLSCTSGTPTPSSAEASESSPAVFTVTSFSDGATCTATEDPIPSGYVADANGTCTGSLSASDEVDSDDDGGDDDDDDGCTIRNRLSSKTFKVRKDFQPYAGGHVSVALVCSGSPTPTVTAVDTTASEADSAEFTVSGYGDSGTSSCTATESSVPAGYSSSGACSASIAAGECTIVNTLNSTAFSVWKDFEPYVGGHVSVALVLLGIAGADRRHVGRHGIRVRSRGLHGERLRRSRDELVHRHGELGAGGLLELGRVHGVDHRG